MSCDGCTIAVAGATNPGIEGLLLGTVPAMPKMLLHHPVLSVEAGADFVQSFHNAWNGKLEGEPYVVVFEGSVADERIAKRTGGYFSARWALKPSTATSMASPCRRRRGCRDSRPAPRRRSRSAPARRGRRAVRGGQSHRRDERHGLSRRRIPERAWSPCDQRAGLRPVGDNFTETVFAILCSSRGSALAGVRRVGTSGVAVQGNRASGLHTGRLLRRGRLPPGMAIPSVSLNLDAGAGRELQHRQARCAQSHGRLHEGRRRLHRLHDARIPGQVLTVLQDPPGATLSTFASQGVGTVMRRLRCCRIAKPTANTGGTCSATSPADGPMCSTRR